MIRGQTVGNTRDSQQRWSSADSQPIVLTHSGRAGAADKARSIDEELGSGLADRIRGYRFDEIQELLEGREA